MDGWLSGLRRSPESGVDPQGSRGFESHPDTRRPLRLYEPSSGRCRFYTSADRNQLRRGPKRLVRSQHWNAAGRGGAFAPNLRTEKAQADQRLDLRAKVLIFAHTHVPQWACTPWPRRTKYPKPHSGFESMARLVIDSNALQSDALRAFLARSKNNFAVINDYLAMEAYKGNTMASIFRSMEILTLFPHQAIILKTTGRIAGLSGRKAGLQRRMIDERQTREFPKFCEALRAAERGNVALRQEILESGRAADSHLERMLASAPIMRDGINELSKQFTQNELTAIRKREPFPGSLIYKATAFMTELTLRVNKPAS
jgi:hypothetical protein